MEAYNQDILKEFEVNLVQASSGKRLANYIIDLIVFYILFFLFTIFIAYNSPQTLDDINTESSGSGLIDRLLDRLLTMLIYGLYMFLIELLFKGKSLGKLITGTRAVNEDGSALTLKSAFLRGISRAVPLDQFSALGTPSYPWHDKWANSYVIDESQSNIIN